jgi:hypothetical protein
MTSVASASLALANAVARFEQASAKLMRATRPESDESAIEAILGMTEAKHQFTAGATLARSADENLGTVLDIKV